MCRLFSRCGSSVHCVILFATAFENDSCLRLFLSLFLSLSLSLSLSETEEEEEAALRQPMQLEKEALIDSLLAQKKYVRMCGGVGVLHHSFMNVCVLCVFMMWLSEELTRALREAALRSKMDQVDLEKP
jgi:hypothetical protein